MLFDGRRKLSTEQFFAEAKEIHGLNLNQQGEEPRRSLSAADAFKLEFPPSPFLLENLFRRGELIILSGARKTSKSFLLADFLMALAQGGAFSERVYARRVVKSLLVDAELSLELVATRLRKLGELQGSHEEWAKHFRILCLKHEGRKINLLKQADREWLETQFQDEEVIAFDNYGKLVPVQAGSSPASWRVVEEWFEQLRRQGRTVLIVQHENKNGQLRGTLKMEDDADLVLSLKRPEEWQPEQGNIFHVHLTASRHLHGAQVVPFTVHYLEDESGFHRVISDQSGDTMSSPLGAEAAVSSVEIENWNLTELEIEILAKAKATSFVKAGEFIDKGRMGRGRSSVTAGLSRLCECGLLEPKGQKRGESIPRQSDSSKPQPEAGGRAYALPRFIASNIATTGFVFDEICPIYGHENSTV